MCVTVCLPCCQICKVLSDVHPELSTDTRARPVAPGCPSTGLRRGEALHPRPGAAAACAALGGEASPGRRCSAAACAAPSRLVWEKPRPGKAEQFSRWIQKLKLPLELRPGFVLPEPVAPSHVPGLNRPGKGETLSRVSLTESGSGRAHGMRRAPAPASGEGSDRSREVTFVGVDLLPRHPSGALSGPRPQVGPPGAGRPPLAPPGLSANWRFLRPRPRRSSRL